MIGKNREEFRPAAPHERRRLMHMDFEDSDRELFIRVYGSEDEASAAMEILTDAPPELQVVASQIIRYIEEVEK